MQRWAPVMYIIIYLGRLTLCFVSWDFLCLLEISEAWRWSRAAIWCTIAAAPWRGMIEWPLFPLWLIYYSLLAHVVIPVVYHRRDNYVNFNYYTLFVRLIGLVTTQHYVHRSSRDILIQKAEQVTSTCGAKLAVFVLSEYEYLKFPPSCGFSGPFPKFLNHYKYLTCIIVPQVRTIFCPAVPGIYCCCSNSAVVRGTPGWFIFRDTCLLPWFSYSSSSTVSWIRNTAALIRDKNIMLIFGGTLRKLYQETTLSRERYTNSYQYTRYQIPGIQSG